MSERAVALEQDALTWGDDEDLGQAEDSPSELQPWKVLVVDDDPAVHSVTALVLDGLTFLGRPVVLQSVWRGSDAIAALRADPQIALVLLDVVMESDDAGLRCVRAIREELRNERVRVVLRTGQPGRAPERDVVVQYEIDGYELKTSVTPQNLLTTVIAALRTFDLLERMEQQRHGLSLIVDAAADLSRRRSLASFAEGVLLQVQALVRRSCGGLFCLAVAGNSDKRPAAPAFVMAGTGRFAEWGGRNLSEIDATGAVESAFGSHSVQRGVLVKRLSISVLGNGTLIVLDTPRKRRALTWIDLPEDLPILDRKLLEVFVAKISIAFENINLLEQLRKTQQATVVALADLAEYRDTDTGEHVLRVARTSDLIARELHACGALADELDELLVAQVGLASILHDVGKVAIPDAVLLKPGRLDGTERALMETHAATGARILQRADRMVGEQTYITVATEIAAAHHEWFNGEGYPKSLLGKQIPVSARIVAVADVFDALTHARPYKEPWPEETAVAYVRERSGTQFDPEIVDILYRVYQKGNLLCVENPTWDILGLH